MEGSKMSLKGLYVFMLLLAAFAVLALAACKDGEKPGSNENGVEDAVFTETSAETADTAAIQDAGGDPFFESFRPNAQRFGDFDSMRTEHIVRALVPYSLTYYFVDNGVQRGVSYELLKLFEEKINKDYKTGNLKIHVIILPTSRDQMIPKLISGYGDIALGNYTITEERLKEVDFSDPIYSGVSEIVVTGPDSPEIKSLDDLSGQEVWVRKSSSYWSSLVKLNESLEQSGKKPVLIKPADENLEDEDILEMLNAGLIEFTVVDRHIGEFWSNVFEGVRLHPDLTVRTGGDIGWMMRKNSPQLKKEVNAFIKENKKGTLHGNMLAKKYFGDTKWVKDALGKEDRERFNSMMEIFKLYAGQYDFDWLMLAAQGYQESHLDQNKRSPAGAVGVMQLLPSTAKDPNVGIPEIEKLENNIHAGTKYLRFVVNRYFNDPAISPRDRMLFAFASYNAGPNKLNQLRKIAAERGLDPNVWFRNVDQVVSEKIGRETMTYVSNIYKYYVAYQIALQRNIEKRSAKRAQGL